MYVVAAATSPARIGAISAGMITLEVRAFHSTAPLPTAAIVAPTMPPIKAWEDDDGTPNHHVTRFHVIAPIKPAKITVSVTSAGLTMPFATVAATLIEMNAPTKFRIAAMPTA